MPFFINPNPHIVTFTTGHKDSRKQHQIMPQGSKGVMPAGAIYEIDLEAGDFATRELVKTGMLKLKVVAAPVAVLVAAPKPPVVLVGPPKVAPKSGKSPSALDANDNDEG